MKTTALLFTLIFLFLNSAFAQTGPIQSDQLPNQILLTISIDYEGQDVDPKNVEAIKEFRARFPWVRMIHFLNPASFTVPGANAERTLKMYESIVNPAIDEIGLHIHPRKSLIENAGVKFRDSPTYLGDVDPEYVKKVQELNLMPWDEPRPQTEKAEAGKFGEIGNDVPFWAYSYEEQRHIIRRGLDILAEHGFHNVTSFRAGGWSASPDTMRALAAEGIFMDSSGVAAEIIAGLYPKSNLLLFNRQIWKNIQKWTQPFKMSFGNATMMQFPNNGGLADYQTPADFFSTFKAVLQAHRLGQSPVFHIGFHLESAAQYLDRVAGGLVLIERYAKAHNIRIFSATFQNILDGLGIRGESMSKKDQSFRRNYERACRAQF